MLKIATILLALSQNFGEVYSVNPGDLIFTPAEGMNDDELKQLMKNCCQANLFMSAFLRGKVPESHLEEALDYLGVDVIEFAQTVNSNLDYLGY